MTDTPSRDEWATDMYTSSDAHDPQMSLEEMAAMADRILPWPVVDRVIKNCMGGYTLLNRDRQVVGYTHAGNAYIFKRPIT